jgi:hypothetical protein
VGAMYEIGRSQLTIQHYDVRMVWLRIGVA